MKKLACKILHTMKGVSWYIFLYGVFFTLIKFKIDDNKKYLHSKDGY